MRSDLLEFMNKKGFTLIEILVVISIIAILATVSISVFSTVQKNNRDQIRIRDMQSIKQALELYRSDNGGYPADTTPADLKPDDLSPKYLTTWPSDPVSGRIYVYTKTLTGFVICAKGESLTSPVCPVSLVCTTSGSANCDLGLASD